MVGEPSVDETIEILHGLRERYEQHHKLKISDDALKAAELSDRYIGDRFTIRQLTWLMKPVAVRLNSALPPAAKELKRTLSGTQGKRRCSAIAKFDEAGELRSGNGA